MKDLKDLIKENLTIESESVLENKKFKKDQMPIIGAIYNDPYSGEKWEVKAYISISGKEKAGGVKSIKDILKQYDESGAMKEYLDEYIGDLDPDELVVGCQIENGDEKMCIQWGDILGYDDLVK